MCIWNSHWTRHPVFYLATLHWGIIGLSRVFIVLGWHKLFIEGPKAIHVVGFLGICTDASGNPHSWPASNGSSECPRGESERCTMTISVPRGTHGVLTSQGSLPHPGLLLTSTLTSCLFLSSVPACSQDFSAPNRMPRLSPLQVCTAAWQIKTALASTLPLPVFPLNYSWIGSASGCMFQSLISRFQFITLSISWHQPRDSPLSPGESVFI